MSWDGGLSSGPAHYAPSCGTIGESPSHPGSSGSTQEDSRAGWNYHVYERRAERFLAVSVDAEGPVGRRVAQGEIFVKDEEREREGGERMVLKGLIFDVFL